MFIIIPAKPFHESKTRLAPVLSPEERAALSFHYLQRTIGIARQVGDVVVVSRGRAVRRLAKALGAWALVEAKADLNQAIAQAAAWIMGRGGQAILGLPADLPLLTVADLQKIIRLGQGVPAVVIAPCHRGSGTNALFLQPPRLIEFQFGPDSFHKHCQAVQEIGLTPIIYHSATIAFDLDRPEDLARLNRELFQK